ncbi:MAG: hypothetical protein IJ672_10380 [Methanobrevibacter sp.]|nr:hypothetical protein [Methanobrevibacter sp.]
MIEYSSCLHYLYNRIYDNEGHISEIELRNMYDSINNKAHINKWLFQCTIKEAKQLYKRNGTNKIIFGGKKNFYDRLKSRITKDEYKAKRLSQLYSIGEQSHHGNRMFEMTDYNKVIFKPNKNEHYEIEIIGIGNRINTLNKIYNLCLSNKITLTYKLDLDYIYLSYEETDIEQYNYEKIDNRIFAIDMNPNYIGWSVIDWYDSDKYKIINSGVFSFKQYDNIEHQYKNIKLSSYSKERIHINNKHKYDILDVCKNLVAKAKYYKCAIFSIEDLNIGSNDKKKGHNYNRLCNNKWYRGCFVNNIIKRCNINNIRLIKVKANYNSFIGNIMFRNEHKPDMILASIEISRRGYEYNLQYIEKTKQKEKNIIFPKLEYFYDTYIKSLEEFNIREIYSNLKDLYSFIKKSKIMYRFPLNLCDLKSFRFKSSLVYQLI